MRNGQNQFNEKYFHNAGIRQITGIKKAPVGAFSLSYKKNYFLDLSEPKRDLNLSTRPPASATFCLPVKNG